MESPLVNLLNIINSGVFLKHGAKLRLDENSVPDKKLPETLKKIRYLIRNACNDDLKLLCRLPEILVADLLEIIGDKAKSALTLSHPYRSPQTTALYQLLSHLKPKALQTVLSDKTYIAKIIAAAGSSDKDLADFVHTLTTPSIRARSTSTEFTSATSRLARVSSINPMHTQTEPVSQPTHP